MRPPLDYARPVTGIDDLVAYFTAARTPRDRLRVGTEHEKIAVLADTLAPLPYAGERSVAALLGRVAQRGGWRAVREDGAVVALEKDERQVTLEPGGQVELSGAPLATVHEFARELHDHLAELRAAAEPLGIAWLALGYRPLGPRAAVPWVPKRRYDLMRPYLAGRGRRAHDMMQMTATVQTNLDFVDDEDCAAAMRAAMAVTSLVTALFANSPIEDGRDTGWLSWRAAAWLETDPDRCGLLPFIFDEGFGPRRYAEWALDVPMFFLRRGGAFRPAGGWTFRRFMREGMEGERPTLGDWELHLSTLFPEVRLRHYIELRGADAGTPALAAALPALCKGLLYDAEARREAERLTAKLDVAARLRLREDVARAALHARAGRGTVRDLARDLVALAREGLRRQAAAATGEPDETRFLAPLDEIVGEGKCPAERVLAAWRAGGGDPRALVRATAYL